MSLPASLSSGTRKYSPILAELTEHKFCRVACVLTDTKTIIEGVKKEKVSWVKRKKWPRGMAMKIEIIDTPDWKGIFFKMIEDLSLNNL